MEMSGSGVFDMTMLSREQKFLYGFFKTRLDINVARRNRNRKNYQVVISFVFLFFYLFLSWMGGGWDNYDNYIEIC